VNTANRFFTIQDEIVILGITIRRVSLGLDQSSSASKWHANALASRPCHAMQLR